jgi:uncharacterized protein (DUF2141 family)
MKQFTLILISVFLLEIAFQQCANPVNPTGGPKDTIPPTLIKSIPTIGAIDFKGQVIILEFDEYINADKIQQNLIITPKTNTKYKHTIKKNILEIRFDKPFSDSTTYSLNFFKGVTDITEKNPIENLTLAFSTGSFIDSMKVSGNVKNLFTQKSSIGFTVGLYPINDTLNYLSTSPVYFTASDEEGNYELEYIKSGKYKIISFKDENGNLLLDPEIEEHGFLLDTITPTSTDSIQFNIRTQLINIKPIQYINARQVAQYIEVKYSREIDTYSIDPELTVSSIVGDKKDVIRIYKFGKIINYSDSIEYVIKTLDSLANSTTNTIKTLFLESNRKLPTFNTTIITAPNKELQNNQKIKLKFSKPIISTSQAKFSFIKDSTFNYQINPILNWNHNMTEVEILTNVNADSLFNSLAKVTMMNRTKLDSSVQQSTDSASISITNNPLATTNNSSIEFQMERGSFISIENDTTKRKTLLFKNTEKKSFGSVNIKLSTEYKNYTLQLLSPKGEVKYKMNNQALVSFPQVVPGNYSIRILIDSNNDGEWSYGNILKNEEPEQVFIYPDQTSVRENWVLDLEISF